MSPEARRTLAEAAATHDAAGASALARDILERWAAETRDAKIRARAERVAHYLRKNPDWGDDPGAFFSGGQRRFVTPGQIVKINWRDALPQSGEPNKVRPGIVASAPKFFDLLPFALIVPLTSSEGMALEEASVSIVPTAENGCTKRSYALSWNVQCVSSMRLTEARSHG